MGNVFGATHLQELQILYRKDAIAELAGRDNKREVIINNAMNPQTSYNKAPLSPTHSTGSSGGGSSSTSSTGGSDGKSSRLPQGITLGHGSSQQSTSSPRGAPEEAANTPRKTTVTPASENAVPQAHKSTPPPSSSDDHDSRSPPTPSIANKSNTTTKSSPLEREEQVVPPSPQKTRVESDVSGSPANPPRGDAEEASVDENENIEDMGEKASDVDSPPSKEGKTKKGKLEKNGHGKGRNGIAREKSSATKNGKERVQGKTVSASKRAGLILSIGNARTFYCSCAHPDHSYGMEFMIGVAAWLQYAQLSVTETSARIAKKRFVEDHDETKCTLLASDQVEALKSDPIFKMVFDIGKCPVPLMGPATHQMEDVTKSKPHRPQAVSPKKIAGMGAGSKKSSSSRHNQNHEEDEGTKNNGGAVRGRGRPPRIATQTTRANAEERTPKQKHQNQQPESDEDSGDEDAKKDAMAYKKLIRFSQKLAEELKTERRKTAKLIKENDKRRKEDEEGPEEHEEEEEEEEDEELIKTRPAKKKASENMDRGTKTKTKKRPRPETTEEEEIHSQFAKKPRRTAKA